MSDGNEHALAVVSQTLSTLPALAQMSDEDFEFALAGMARMRERLRRVHLEVMKQDVDYGKIPGTDKDTLLKPGAELLFKMNRCVPKFERSRTVGDGVTSPSIAWDSACFAVSADGNISAEGSGSCNSWERKYRWRNAERECPECHARAIIKGQAQYGGGFVCWKKRDGCGAKFPDDDQRITEQMMGQVENPDPWDLDNTLKKMSDKRAMVACALTLQAASGSFTQDLDDEQEASRPSEKKAAVSRRPVAAAKPTAPVDAPLAKISEKQVKLLWFRAAEKAKEHVEGGVSREDVVRDVLRVLNLEHTADLPASSFDRALELVVGWEPGLYAADAAAEAAF